MTPFLLFRLFWSVDLFVMLHVRGEDNSQVLERVHPFQFVTSWTSWLKATTYYATNLPKLREIVIQRNCNGLLFTRGQASRRNSNPVADFVSISRCNGSSVTNIPRMVHSSYTIREAFKDIMKLDFLEDPCKIKPYILQRISANEMKEIVAMERTETSPTLFAMLHDAQPTTTSVERACSLVDNVFKDDRPFHPHSVSAYMQLLYKSPFLPIWTFLLVKRYHFKYASWFAPRWDVRYKCWSTNGKWRI